MQFSVKPIATVVTTLIDAHRTHVDGVIGPVNATTQHATSL
jgi:hypothetical protein